MIALDLGVQSLSKSQVLVQNLLIFNLLFAFFVTFMFFVFVYPRICVYLTDQENFLKSIFDLISAKSISDNPNLFEEMIKIKLDEIED